MTSTSAIGITGAVTCMVFLLAIQLRAEIGKQRKERLRRLWRRKIEEIADDRSTDPAGMSLDEIMDSLEPAYWEELYAELEKMLPGQRSLRKAVERLENKESQG